MISKTKKKPLDYKNVHRRVKRLFDLGLICEDKQPIRPSIHGAIYYKLTDFGVYYVIKNTQICSITSV